MVNSDAVFQNSEPVERTENPIWRIGKTQTIKISIEVQKMCKKKKIPWKWKEI